MSVRALILAAFLPVPVAAQVDPVSRLSEVLPSEISERVLESVEAALDRDLPAEAVAHLALEGVAKGRSPEEVLSAVEALVGDMGRALAALERGGRAPDEGEIEAATTAMRMGVDGAEISELARSQAQGRGLAVPLLVLGSLAERGLPSDQALAAVRARLGAGADDSSLVGDVLRPGRGPATAMDPPGHAIGGGVTGLPTPAAGVGVPVGPPTDNTHRGRGRGRGGS